MALARTAQGLKALAAAHPQALGSELAAATASLQHLNWYGSVPEFWGRDSRYHGGTDFLGTPKNHLELAAKRPLSPHVFEIDYKQMHYKFPLAALSSIANRATGVALSGIFGIAGVAALGGDLGATIVAMKEAYPLLVYPAKAAIAFPLSYHYVAGLRHLYWDHVKYGNMAEKNSPLELPAIEASSKATFGAAAVIGAALTLYSL